MPTDVGEQPDGYIRGGRVAPVEATRVVRVLVLVVIAIMIGLTALFAVIASGDNSRAARLRSSGVPVRVTVTGCVGVSSGIGMGIEYWECRGRFGLGGRTYDEVIGGSRQKLAIGTTVDALAVPADPALLSLPGAIHPGSSNWTAPIVLGAVTAVLIAGYGVLRRRSRRR